MLIKKRRFCICWFIIIIKCYLNVYKFYYVYWKLIKNVLKVRLNKVCWFNSYWVNIGLNINFIMWRKFVFKFFIWINYEY